MISKKKIGRRKKKVSKLKGGNTDNCELERLVMAGKKCGPLKSKCNIKHLKEKMEYYKFFKAEKNKNFVENYLKKFTLKFVGKDQQKIENTMIILDCVHSVGNLHVILYKIYKTNTNTDSKYFKEYVDLKETQKDPTILEISTNNDKKSLMFKEEINKVSINFLVEFIIDVIIESILTYEQIQKKEVKLEFKKQFESFIKNTDTNQEANIGIQQGIQQTMMQNKKQEKLVVGNGIVMNHYIELRNIYIKKGSDTAPKKQKDFFNDLYNKKKDILKKDLIDHYNNEKTQTIIENLYSIGIMDTQDKSEKLVERMIGKTQSPKYLFFVLGMVIFALLLKFNVLAGSPITGSGTI